MIRVTMTLSLMMLQL